jgi:hypothetical protein
MKELGTFGAIISFALVLETQAFAFYESIDGTKLDQTITNLLKGSTKRIARLKRIRQELVTEMILEPISGIDGDTFALEISSTPGEDSIINQAVNIEDNMGAFYTTAASLIPMKEVESAFYRLAKENWDRKTKLEELESSN